MGDIDHTKRPGHNDLYSLIRRNGAATLHDYGDCLGNRSRVGLDIHHGQPADEHHGAGSTGRRLATDDGTGATLGTTQHGGVTVTITSSDPTRLLLSRNSSLVGEASITVPMVDGQSFVPYVVHGVENTTGSATVTLWSPGLIGDSSRHRYRDWIEIHELDPTMSVIGGEDNNLYVQVGIPNAQGTALASVQQVRAGAPLVVTLTNRTPSWDSCDPMSRR